MTDVFRAANPRVLEPKVGDEVGTPPEGDDELDPDVRSDPVPEAAGPDVDEEDPA